MTTETKMPDAAIQGRLLSCRQVQEMLGVSIATIFRLIKNKKDPLPSVKIGRMLKFPLDKVLWWIEKHAST